MKARSLAVSLFLALALCQTAGGQVRSLGTWHSRKGAGLTMQVPARHPGESNTFTVYAELGDIYAGHLETPGGKFVFSHNISILSFEGVQEGDISLFAGAGASAGWVKDYGREGFGMMAAVNGSFGASAAFTANRIHVSAGVTIEAGPWLQKTGDNYSVSLYRNGIYRSFYPYISISYLFR